MIRLRVAAMALAVGATAGMLASCGPQSHDSAVVDAGRRIFHDGVLPDGSPLVATRPEGLVLEGRFAACASCHRKSGMGTIEGLIDSAILVPPLAGPVLFRAAPFAGVLLDDSHHYIPHESWRRAMTRPAYDRDSLAAALRDGRNTAGDRLGAPMPLYELDQAAMDALASYLRQLGAKADPGIDADTIHVASVTTPEVNAEDADGVLEVLRIWAKSSRAGGRPWTLHEWHLSGPSATWQMQLDKFFAEQSVFALVSGAGAAEWQPVDDFCESREVLCVLPSLDAGPEHAAGHFSVYWTRGVRLEARILAKHFDDKPLQRVLQVYKDDAGLAGAETLAANWSGGVIETRRYDSLEHSDLVAAELVILWLRQADVSRVLEMLPSDAAIDVVISAQLASPENVSIPPARRPQTAFVSLFDDLGLQGEIARLRLQRWIERNDLSSSAKRRMQADAYAAAHLFNAALASIRREELRRPRVPLTREHVLETLETLVTKYSDGTQLIDEDSHVAYYGRMSLGPGQRIAVRGGSILRYASAESERLIAASEHIVP